MNAPHLPSGTLAKLGTLATILAALLGAGTVIAKVAGAEWNSKLDVRTYETNRMRDSLAKESEKDYLRRIDDKLTRLNTRDSAAFCGKLPPNLQAGCE